MLVFSLSTVSYVDVAYADTVQVQTYSDLTQIVSGAESDTTQTNPHLTTSIGSAGLSAIEQIGTTSQHTSTIVNTLTETFEIYQNQYPASVNTLTIMEATPNETNQNQPFTNANTLTETDTIETNQNQYSSVNALTDTHESSETACPEKR